MKLLKKDKAKRGRELEEETMKMMEVENSDEEDVELEIAMRKHATI